jgi:ketosteroid isomerase-like protein
MSKDADIQAEIRTMLAAYQTGYSRKNTKMLLDATDEKVFGAEALKQQLERDFAQSGELAMDFGPMTIASEGNVAWCAGDCAVSAEVGGQSIRLEGRMTMVLRKAGNKWLFAHSHFSVPDRGQQEGQSFPKK